MDRRISPLCARLLLAALLLFVAAPARAQAQPIIARARSWIARLVGRGESHLTRPGGNAFRIGRDLVVNDGENLDNVACFLCSARVNGAAQGNLLVFAGNTYLNGPVRGDVVDLGGRVTLTGNARIGGELVVFGGRLQQDAGSTIGRKLLIVGPIVFLPMVAIVAVLIAGLIFLLRVVFGRFGSGD